MSEHKILSYIKSAIRILGCIITALLLKDIRTALAVFITTQGLAEVVGIIEEFDAE